MDLTGIGVAEQVNNLLDAATPAVCLDDDELRSRVVECEQAMAMLQAVQADAMVQMGSRAGAADRAERDATGRPLWSAECREEFVADEIAVLLACTRVAASLRYQAALQAADHPVVRRAWRSGQVDARKVSTICEQIHPLDSDAAGRLAAEAVDYATQPGRSRTAPQVREWLRRRVIAADPDAAEQRRRRALADRRVVITPGEDGMSELWALLPAVQARQIQQALTTTAQGLGADDARTMDQRRADTLADLLLGRGEPAGVSIEVIISADTLQGTSDDPAWIPGLGAITAPEARELAGVDASSPRVSLRRLLADPTTGVLTDVTEQRYRPSAALDRAVRARDVTCRFPGCRRSADSASTDLDHTIPWPAGPTSASNLAVLCRRHHRLKHTAGWTVSLSPNGTMTWTTPTGRTVVTLPWQYTDPPTT